GKDSMKNDYVWEDLKISVLPTLLFSVIGKIEDVRNAVSMDFKNAGDAIYIVGLTDARMAYSEYFCLMQRGEETEVPLPHREINREIFYRLHNLMKMNIIKSCHDISDGGLAVALAESAFAGGLGAEIEIKEVPCTVEMREDFILFSETPGRFILTVGERERSQFENLMKGVPLCFLGYVSDSGIFTIKKDGKELIRENIENLMKSFLKTLDF
ncbi:MAG: AIR synthase-related protein, partial [Deltaproteobacteria bacterium]|nr:AIR synthase-related protein [Deltaproteobacteria bacterium]